MDRAYVSEFTAFMDHYLEDHPEVVKEQMCAFNFFYYPKIDLEELENEDIIPDDHYGFTTLFEAPHKKTREMTAPPGAS